MTNIRQEINCLEEFIFIGGSEFVLAFDVFDGDGVAIDLSTATVEWTLSYYGQEDYAVLTKTGNVTAINTFEVTLAYTDTEALYGLFVQQPIVTDFDGSEFRPSQGKLTISPRIRN